MDLGLGSQEEADGSREAGVGSYRVGGDPQKAGWGTLGVG